MTQFIQKMRCLVSFSEYYLQFLGFLSSNLVTVKTVIDSHFLHAQREFFVAPQAILDVLHHGIWLCFSFLSKILLKIKILYSCFFYHLTFDLTKFIDLILKLKSLYGTVKEFCRYGFFSLFKADFIRFIGNSVNVFLICVFIF